MYITKKEKQVARDILEQLLKYVDGYDHDTDQNLDMVYNFIKVKYKVEIK